MDVTLRQYSGSDHLSLAMLADMNRWIMDGLGCA
jgi:hypothetical protein